MAAYGQSLTVEYVAVNTSTNVYQTGDAANHTLRWIKDGTSAAPTNAGSITEVDAVNAPGVYKITLTATECQCWFGMLAGKSSTANVALTPVSISFENAPTATPGTANGLPTLDASAHLLAYSVSQPVTLDLTQAVPSSNAAQSVGDALLGARTGAFGKWAVDNSAVPPKLTLYAADGVTAVRVFDLSGPQITTARS